MAGTREDWFPTTAWYFDHPNPSILNAALLANLRAERERDAAGMPHRSTVGGWHSQDDLHLREWFRELLGFLTAGVAEVVAFQHWDPARITPTILSCWAITNGPGASNTVHNHPNSYLSGVYYLQAPDRSGDLFFLDPRTPATMLSLPLLQTTPWTTSRVGYRPLPGRLILFPSWLYHGVEPNRSSQDRVCVSFNVGVRWKGDS